MLNRRAMIATALESFQGLGSVIADLTENEVLACLELEAATLRRQSVIDRLIARAVRLRELSYAATLKEKYSGSSQSTQEPQRR
jgi:hypothetical protein